MWLLECLRRLQLTKKFFILAWALNVAEVRRPPPLPRLRGRQNKQAFGRGFGDLSVPQDGGYGGGYGGEGGALRKHLGTGPGTSGDKYTRIDENPFIRAEGGNAVSTFSIDVDTASYANVRQFLDAIAGAPPADAVRIEELVNYFDYDYAGPD